MNAAIRTVSSFRPGDHVITEMYRDLLALAAAAIEHPIKILSSDVYVADWTRIELSYGAAESRSQLSYQARRLKKPALTNI